MNISKTEQRVLHALAQGGRIVHRRDHTGRIVAADCFTRDGYVLTDCTVALFRRLKRRGPDREHGRPALSHHPLRAGGGTGAAR